MIDLTPLDVRKKRGDFRRLLRGYDTEEVDTFMDLVAERMEELVRENLALSDKANRIESQLSALEGREKAIQDALVSAQKLREEVRDQTQRDAEVLKEQSLRAVNLQKAEAEGEIARRLGAADELIRERQRALEDLERSRLKFLKAFRGLLERELDAVEVEEARRPLEDVPLELEFRGWMPTHPGGLEAQEAQARAVDPADESAVDSTDESAVDPADESAVDSAEDASTLVGEVPGGEDLALAEEAPILTDETGMGIQEDPAPTGVEEVGGFVTQVLEVPPPPDLMEPSTERRRLESGTGEEAVREEAVREEVVQEGAVQGQAGLTGQETGSGAHIETDMPPAEEHNDARPPDQPRWLFSLLKREEEEGEGRGS